MWRDGPYSAQTYKNRFGSWNEALREAGIMPENLKNIPDDILSDDLRDIAADLGKTPTTEEYNMHGRFSTETFRQRFLTWWRAVWLAGCDTTPIDNPPREHLLETLQILALELHRTPTAADIEAHGAYPAELYRDIFGTLTTAFRAAGVHDDLEVLEKDSEAPS